LADEFRRCRQIGAVEPQGCLASEEEVLR
jgi:hypothetical protein